jgi:hypothetical protein
MRMAKARPPSPQEVLRGHYEHVSALVASGASEVEVGATLAAAEAAGLVRTALMMAVREGALDRERRAVVAAELDHYRMLLDRPDPAPAAEVGEAASRLAGPRGGRLR